MQNQQRHNSNIVHTIIHLYFNVYMFKYIKKKEDKEKNKRVKSRIHRMVEEKGRGEREDVYECRHKLNFEI